MTGLILPIDPSLLPAGGTADRAVKYWSATRGEKRRSPDDEFSALLDSSHMSAIRPDMAPYFVSVGLNSAIVEFYGEAWARTAVDTAAQGIPDRRTEDIAIKAYYSVHETGRPESHMCWGVLSRDGKPEWVSYARVLIPIYIKDHCFVLSAVDTMRPCFVTTRPGPSIQSSRLLLSSQAATSR